MNKYRAIPQGYMTVGEIAKKMGVTVRTLQYYDKEGLLSPSSESEGGRRLYTHKEIVKLHQILSMKHLGFSLDEIKVRLPSISTPKEASIALMAQAEKISEQITSLASVLESIKKLNEEILQTNTMDWKKYADILTLLRNNDENYWLLKHFSKKVYERICIFDKENADDFMNTLNWIFKKAGELKDTGIPPESEQDQALAKEFWDMVMFFTKNDTSLLPELIKLAGLQEDAHWKSKHEFIEKAVEVYFKRIGYNPFEEVNND